MHSVPLPSSPRRRGRPPKNPAEPLQDTRGLLVRTGVVVLTEKGYSSVGIDEILRLAQVPKGSFYHYFDSKEAFGQVLIAAYAAYFARKLDRWLLDAATPPLQRLHYFIDDAKAGMRRHGYQRGCLVGNLGQEMGTLPESFRAQLEQVFLDWQERTAACLAAAQRVGEVAAHHDCA
ncbi:MAG: TetR family transcriptional regulator C-terminal domain-containing protein, partial [Burkholderiales bacterium]